MPNLFNKPFSIREFLKVIYGALAPKGSWFYSMTHITIRQLLNRRYRYWLKHFDCYGEEDYQNIRNTISQLPHKPLISVIMPAFNSDLHFLDQAIQSVRNQVYPYWELCIADDASTKPGVREIIQKHCEEEPKIIAVYRSTNGHISAASNSALSLATGQFIALLDHDDVLHPLALFYVVKEINAHPKSAVIYSDEDKITPRGKRIDPYFKSDFDYDLFLSQNMVSHLGVYQQDLINQIGGFREGLEGSQDYDLLLRLLPLINLEQIRHIPKVLYHWRISAQSAADRIEIKPYALEAGKKALIDYLENKNIQADVNIFHNFGYKIKYALPKPAPSVELIVLMQNALAQYPEGIISLLEQTHSAYSNLNLCLITSKANNQYFEDTRLNGLINKLLTFNSEETDLATMLNNQIDASTAEYIALIKDNCISGTPDWLANLIAFAHQPGVGCVSPKFIDLQGFVYSCGLILSDYYFAQHLFHGALASQKNYYFGWSSLHKNYSALPDACLIIKKAHFIATGGFDNTLSDYSACCLDLCLKIKKAGLRNVLIPDIAVTFADSKKPGSGMVVQNQQDRHELLARYHHFFKNDPAFNPNLTMHKGKPAVSTKDFNINQ